MGHRLSKITTRTGDSGETGLGDGARVAKDSARIAALGDIDDPVGRGDVFYAECRDQIERCLRRSLARLP